ncbi:hypothetical protein [Caldimicrobium thiodismutans]|uniref:hypothetical protein n=1 Tax=Caldimicrobium thiodismutans TaxID=1653476 RepID=UPI001E3009CA|nr:hypothetical protein [Caldimicrobium thiodismutans]
MKKFQEVCPFKIRGVKTDNGSEFLGEFDRYLKEEGIRHYFNYPRFPKGNGYVERFNLCYALRKNPIESQKIWAHTESC